MSFTCAQCFDTRTIDQGGAEITCPFCLDFIEVKITGLGWGLGETGERYETCSGCTSSTITFVGEHNDILKDVARVRQHDVAQAKSLGLKGRNNVSSGAIAIERRVRKALSN